MSRVPNGAPKSRMTLAARDVSFAYQRREPIVSQWSAEFVPGSMTALTGPSGRGKSTLLYLLGLMLRPASGDVLVDGEPSGRLSDARRAALRARAFGFVFQDAALDQTRTLIDNVTEPALYRGDDRIRAAQRGRALLDRFGVDLPSDRKPGQISGGQAQRIALSRALVTEPPILLADEPTGNLDPVTTEFVVCALRDYALAGGVVVLVTHSIALAARCDRELQL